MVQKKPQKAININTTGSLSLGLPDVERDLLRRRQEILEQFKVARSHLDEQVMQAPGDTADESVIDLHADYFFNLAQQNQRELTEIRDALERIHQGKYGVCEDCQNPISAERLKHVPYARSCIECQRLREKRSPLRIISPR